ncbi:MAG TPA: MBL fold metallo-hydrolase [Deltaproteobacteria bacterium]|nr:MBL fold metallo-hydrolase [Deltaproteobacteria bacterium]
MESILKHLHWLGHDCFLYDGGPVIYFDPYELKRSEPKADIILITHEHFDHCSPDDVKKVQEDDTVIVTDSKSASKLKGNVKVVKPGDSITVFGVKIEAYPAYNTNKQFHPQNAGMLSFVVTINDVSVYHAGDTDVIEEMENIHPDIALLPVSGTYVMTAEEAAEAALKLKPKIAVPMHFGSIVGSDDDARRFKKLLEGKVEVRILPKE